MKLNKLYLRKLIIEDANENYLSWFNDNNSSNFIEYSKKNQITTDDLKKFILRYNSNNSLLLGVFEKTTNLHIGNIKYEPINYTKKFAVLGVFIGIKEFRGKGLFSEIFKKSKKILLRNFSLNSICLKVSKKNYPAIQAYKKENFKKINNNEDYFFNNISEDELGMVYRIKND